MTCGADRMKQRVNGTPRFSLTGPHCLSQQTAVICENLENNKPLSFLLLIREIEKILISEINKYQKNQILFLEIIAPINIVRPKVVNHNKV